MADIHDEAETVLPAKQKQPPYVVMENGVRFYLWVIGLTPLMEKK